MSSATIPSAPSNLLGYDDEVFLRSTTVMGTPVVGQMAWRFPGVIPVEDVQAVVDRMARGPLSRVVVRPRVPGARSRWVRSSLVPQVDVAPEPIAPSAVVAWLASTLDIEHDPTRGPLWGMSMAYTTDGRTIVAYNSDHVIADGGMKLSALVEAVEGRSVPRLPVDDPAAMQVTVADELRDAATMWGRTARGIVAAVRQPRPAPSAAQTSAARPAPAPAPGDDEVHAVPFVAVDCSTAAWEATARAAGGTSNGLLAAIAVELVLEAGIAEAGRPVRIVLPVSMRAEGDWRSNATSGVSIDVETELRDGAGRVTDLAHIRSRSKAEFAALYAGTRPDPTAPLRPLVQAVPDRVAGLLTRGITTPLCLASNLGAAAPALVAPFGVPCEALHFQAAAMGATRGELRRLRGGLATWWGSAGETCTLGLRWLDPDSVPDVARLREVVEAVYGRWGLTPAFW